MGDVYKGLVVKFGGDAGDLKRAIGDVASAVKGAQSHIKTLDSALKFDPSSMDAARMKLQQLGNLTTSYSEKADLLRNSMERAAESGAARFARAVGDTSAALAQASSQYDRADHELEALRLKLIETASAANWQGTIGPKQTVAQFARELERVGLATEEDIKSAEELAKAHNKAQARLESTKSANAYVKDKENAALLDAQIKATARDAVELSHALGLSDDTAAKIKRVREELKATDEVTEALKAELSSIDEALQLDPTDVRTLTARFRTLNEVVENSKEKARQLEREIAGFEGRGITDAGLSLKQLGTQAATAQERLVAARMELSRMEAALRSLENNLAASKQGEEYKQLEGQIKQTRVEVNRLRDAVKAADVEYSTAQARQEVRKLRNELTRTQAEATNVSLMGSTGVNWRGVGTGLYSTVTPAIAMAAMKVIDSAEDIDSAYRDMRKTVEGTEEDFERLRKAAIEYSQTHVTSADTILEMEALGGQMGITVDKLEEFATVASNLDIATNIDAEDIAQDLGQLNNVLHWIEGDMGRFADALVRLGNNMPAQESAIMNVTKRIGAAGTMYGMTTPQILAWATAVAATGQNSEAAGTAISNTLSLMEQSVAAGSDDLVTLANISGVTADEFARAWTSDPSSAFQMFIQGLRNIEDSGGSAEVALASLGINGVRQKQALKGLTSTIDVLNDALVMSNNAWGGVADQWGDAGDAAREAQKKSEGFSGALAKMRNNADALASELGEAMLPLIEQATILLKTGVDILQGMPKELETVAVCLAGIVAVLGPIITFGTSLKSIKTVIAGFMSTMAALGRAGKTAAIGVRALSAATSLLKFGAVGIGLAALTAIVGKIGEAASKTAAMNKATTGLENAFSPTVGALAGVSEAASAVAENASGAIGNIDSLIQKQGELVDSINTKANEVQVENSKLDYYRQLVKELSGSTSDIDAAKLAGAVTALNAACGGTEGNGWTLVRDEAGAISALWVQAGYADSVIQGLSEHCSNQNVRDWAAQLVELDGATDPDKVQQMADACNNINAAFGRPVVSLVRSGSGAYHSVGVNAGWAQGKVLALASQCSEENSEKVWSLAEAIMSIAGAGTDADFETLATKVKEFNDAIGEPDRLVAIKDLADNFEIIEKTSFVDAQDFLDKAAEYDDPDGKIASLASSFVEMLDAINSGSPDVTVSDLKNAIHDFNKEAGTGFTVGETVGGQFKIINDKALAAYDSVDRLIRLLQVKNTKEAYDEWVDKSFENHEQNQAERGKAESNYEFWAYEFERLSSEYEALYDKSEHGWTTREEQERASQALLDWIAENGEYFETVRNNRDEALALLNDITDLDEANMRFYRQVQEAQSVLNEAEMDEYALAMGSSLSSINAFAAAFANNDKSLYQFYQTLHSTGIAAKEFSDLSAREINALAAAYDGSVESIILGLASMEGVSSDSAIALSQALAGVNAAVQNQDPELLAQYTAQLQQLADVWKESDDPAEQAAASFVQAYVDKLSAGSADAETNAQTVADSAETGLTDEEGAQAAAQTTMDAYGEEIEGYAETAGDYAEEVDEAVLDELDDEDGGSDAGDNLVGGYTDAITAGKADATTAAQGVHDAVVGVFANMYTEGYNIGSNLMIGMKNGIDDNASEPKTAASNAGAGAIEGAHLSTGVRSPSRFTYEIGGYVSEGLARGIMDKAYMPINAASTLGDRTINAANISNAAYAAASAGRRSVYTQSAAGVSQAQVFDAVSAALGQYAGRPIEAVVAVDGRELSRAMAAHNDVELGKLQQRKGR